MKLLLDGLEIVVDIGVIELEVVEDQRASAVVDELGALVEERRIVFVGLDDEMPGAGRKAGAGRKIARHAADQESGLETGVFEDPRQHARGRGLAVSSRDCQHVHVAQHFARQPVGTRGVGNIAVAARPR